MRQLFTEKVDVIQIKQQDKVTMMIEGSPLDTSSFAKLELPNIEILDASPLLKS
jgi:hypothetical protein